MKVFTFKSISILVILISAVVIFLPTVFNDVWPYKKINLGLDLQGGMDLVLEVENHKALEAEVERIIHEIKKVLRKKNIKHLGIERLEDNSILAKIVDQKNMDEFDKILSDQFSGLKIGTSEKSGNYINKKLQLPEAEADNIKKMATEQALETIRNRIDEFGVSEPDIRIQGDKRILIQLPGIKDPQRAKNLMGRTAQLTFQLLDEENDVQAAIKGTPPVGDIVLHQKKGDPSTGNTISIPYLVKKRVLLDGGLLTNARVEFDQFQQPQVGIEFNRKGARIFDKVTGENIGKRLAIVLDDSVYSAPVIQNQIAGGKAVITGNFSLKEAKDLAIALRAGALPAPVKIIQETTVGPTLGSDSKNMGINSMLIGGILVILFMLVYYKAAGVIANIALLINILLIGAGLAALQATLTLPGIAGIILTIGMAVDANVIIFERIREELAFGKTMVASVNAGFERATLTILDANITTLIVAIVLYQFGTGPIKGFAVTLALGIISSLFTALILSKSIFNFVLHYKKSSSISI